MTQLALADFLTDFAAPQIAAREASPAAPAPAAPPPPCALPEIDIDAIVAREVARAQEEMRSELSTAAEAAMSVERARHQMEITQMQVAFGTEAAARITTALEEAEERLASLVTASTTRILSSVLSDDLAQRSVSELAARIREATADREALRIKVAGPQSLLDSLTEALGPLADRCDFTESDGLDVTVSIDDALFETRLAEWAGQIGGIVS
ncbi:MAG: hypothetical protein M9944_04930 [Rhizobiaceae bacterium]|nr:hypothetical protein [Rhizobiaceae bacterium]